MKQAAAILLALAQTLALAQAPSNPPASTRAPGAGGATFMCGGVGEADQQRMKALAGQYDLMLTFAASSGAYLADVGVEIKDSKGGVALSARCDGPIMLVTLPRRGSWHITAQANGQAQQKTISAGAGQHAQASFVWAAGS